MFYFIVIDEATGCTLAKCTKDKSTNSLMKAVDEVVSLVYSKYGHTILLLEAPLRISVYGFKLRGCSNTCSLSRQRMAK
jgi:hypothetical protein